MATILYSSFATPARDTGETVPNYRLPPEILQIVFSYIFESIDLGSRKGYIWTVRRVCVHWRDAVDNNPLFWSCWNLGPVVQVKEEVLRLRMKLAMQLSKSAPLIISFNSTGNIKSIEEDMIRNLRDLFFSNRSAVIHLKKLHDYFIMPVTLPLDQEIDNLEEIGIRRISMRDGTGIHFFQNVRKLVLRRTLFFSTGELSSFFLSIHKLEDLTLENVCITDTTPVEKVTLSTLHTLRLQGTSYILSMIYAPSLVRLVIGPPDAISNELAGFLKTSGSTIRSLTAINAHGFRSTLARIINLIGGIENLSLLQIEDVKKLENMISMIESNTGLQSLKVLEVGVALDRLIPNKPDIRRIVPQKTMTLPSLSRFKCISETIGAKEFWDGQYKAPFETMKELCAADGVYFESEARYRGVDSIAYY